jgi:purine-binding chemotaxis protein CheW
MTQRRRLPGRPVTEHQEELPGEGRLSRDESPPQPVLEEGAASVDVHVDFAERKLQFLVARIGGELFALPVHGVEEILEVEELRPLPEGDVSLLGLCPVRGRLLPVYDAQAHLGGIRRSATALALVLHSAGRRVGIAVDDAEEVIGVAPSSIRRAPARDVDERLIRGVFLHEGRLLTLLDIEALALRYAPATGAEYT